jgi:hypothetical protein
MYFANKFRPITPSTSHSATLPQIYDSSRSPPISPMKGNNPVHTNVIQPSLSDLSLMQAQRDYGGLQETTAAHHVQAHQSGQPEMLSPVKSSNYYNQKGPMPLENRLSNDIFTGQEILDL